MDNEKKEKKALVRRVIELARSKPMARVCLIEAESLGFEIEHGTWGGGAQGRTTYHLVASHTTRIGYVLLDGSKEICRIRMDGSVRVKC